MELDVNSIKLLAEERNLSEEVIFSSVEDALASTYEKFRPVKHKPVVSIDRENGSITIFDVKTCVEDGVKVNNDEISLLEARKNGFIDAVPGQILRIPVTEHPEKFGRIAAQTARQAIIQRLNEAKREILNKEFNDKIGDLLTGTIFKSEGDQIIVRLADRNEAVLPREERIAGEEYLPDTTMKFYLLNVRTSGRGPRLVVSRSHPALLRKLLEMEIPEIHDGIVEIKGTVREAGARAKVAVYSTDANVDPVGACVGNSGARIKSISSELCDEKIDIIIWSEDPLEYIKNALSPAKVTKVEEVPGQAQTAKVYAPADQLSLAIGKAGQNVRLAAKLTGWHVDINTLENEQANKTHDLEEAEV